MSLPAVAGNTIYASDLYGLCQPSGGSETDAYYINGGGQSGWNITCWCATRSRVSTPVSCSTPDQSIQTITSNLATPATNHLTQYGVQVYSHFTANASNENVGGVVTFNF